jgi:hypothetical protein
MAQRRQSQRQQEPDPLEQAMQLYQMFSAPQQSQGLDIAKLIASENQADYQDQTLGLKQAEQDEQLRIAQEKNDILQRDVETRAAAANQKAALTPEQLLFLGNSYTDPKTSATQRAVLKRILPPEVIADIETAQQQTATGLGLGGQPAAGAGQTAAAPITPLSNPLAFGSELGNQARTAVGLDPNTEPFGFKRLFQMLFGPKQTTAMQPNPAVYNTPNQPLPY